MKTKLLLLIFSLLSFLPLSGQTPLPFNEGSALYGLWVEELGSGREVVNHQGAMAALPASVTKLITTATALELYGPEWRFETHLLLQGEVKSGVLEGSVVIRGNGDPTIGSKHFASSNPEADLRLWVDKLWASGVRFISGGVVVDNSLYGTEVIPTKWLWEDMGNYYAAGVWCVNLFDNRYSLQLESGAVGTRPVIKGVTPKIGGLSFENHLLAAANNKDSAYIYGMPMDGRRKLYGTIPAGRSKFTISGDIPNPALLLGDRITEMLRERGVQVGAEALVRFEPTSRVGERLLYTHRSPTLLAISRVVNVVSHNLYADALMRLIAQKGEKGATFQDGVTQTKRYWKSRGLSLDGVALFDGSGLSPSNRFSAKVIGDLLRYMAQQSNYSTQFFSTLPVGGIDRSEFKGTALDGRVSMKSGTMGGVRCYAGYVEGRGGKRYLFAFMANDLEVSSATIRERFVNTLLGLGL